MSIIKEDKKIEINLPKSLIPNRICIALSSYGLNEFYISFKYLKMILIYLYNKKLFDLKTIKDALLAVSKYYGSTRQTIINALGKLFNMLPTNFFIACPLYVKIKMNCFHKIQYIAQIILEDIKLI